MDDFGVSKLLWLGVAALLAWWLFGKGGRSHSSMPLVLRRFAITENPPDGIHVEIVGRTPGLIAWFLTILGIDDDIVMQVHDHYVLVESVGLKGKTRTLVPTKCIASSTAGYSRSIISLILAILFGLMALYSGLAGDSARGMLGLLIVAGICFAFYWFSKKLSITIETFGGDFIGLAFKPSLIEFVSVDFDSCAAVIAIIERLILTTSHGPVPAAAMAAPSPAAPTRPSAPPEPPPPSCGKCGSLVEAASAFCGECGAPLGK